VTFQNHNAQIRFRTILGVPVLTMDNATSTAIAVTPNLRTVFVASIPATAVSMSVPDSLLRLMATYSVDSSCHTHIRHANAICLPRGTCGFECQGWCLQQNRHIVVGLTSVLQKITDIVRSRNLASFTAPKVNDGMIYTWTCEPQESFK
jgi:hypothetical protein